MTRVHVICEGQTEEMFVNELLQAHFNPRGIYLVPALIGKPGHRGGNFKYERLFNDVRNRLLGEREAFCTTFFDFYGLPENFPGKRNTAISAGIEDKSEAIQAALVVQLQSELGVDAMRRFVPFVQMYEFEALLFSDPQAFSQGVGSPDLQSSIYGVRRSFDTPEHINDSPQTAPSKRILELMPSYEKPLLGSLAAIEIGLETIRQECRLFDNWLMQLEALPTGSS